MPQSRKQSPYLYDRIHKPWYFPFQKAKYRAKDKGLPFKLTANWAETRWTGYCEITGLPFKLRNKIDGNTGPHPYAATIDRINRKRGYTPSNCRFILHAVNNMKGVGTDKDMLVIAKALVRRLS